MEVMNACGALRRVENPGALLQETRDKGCAFWLILDPLCHQEALAQLYDNEPDTEKTILFLKTTLAESSEVSPWLAALSLNSPMERWINESKASGWGFYFTSDAPFSEILAHLRSLVFIKRGEKRVIFRFWDGRILTRICQGIPEDIPMLLGPIRRILTQDEGDGWICIDRDGDAYMEEAHRPGTVLPSPWYAFTDRHDRLFHGKRPGIVARNIVESLFNEKMEHGLALPPNEALSAFVARHVNRGLALGLWGLEALELFVRCCLRHGECFPDAQAMPVLSPLARTPLDEDAAVAVMRRFCNQGGSHV
ncbi:DUF4123 domain-containing protein [Desulfomicrobium escambiense]|uniref:DUF4123 domain-containing protein n=1 Tax=Desulfomicrobium escambiense TaxID=29503 RepID=UPI000405B59B|nr:DUF4123 domain-containing protein [Desulfomicrobium escambiense]